MRYVQDIYFCPQRVYTCPWLGHCEPGTSSVRSRDVQRWTVLYEQVPVDQIKQNFLTKWMMSCGRVLKDFKGKAAIHVEWVKAWGQCLAELQVQPSGA